MVKPSRRKQHRGAVVAGVALAAAGAAGAYLLSGKKGAARRKKLSIAARKIGGDVRAALRGAKGLSEKAYGTAVDAALKKYAAIKDIDPREVSRLTREIKNEWRDVAKTLKKTQKIVGKKVGRKVKTAVRAVRKRNA